MNKPQSPGMQLRRASLAPLVVMCVLLVTACQTRESSAALPATWLSDLHARLDLVHPGRGTTDYGFAEPADVPSAYAMVLMGQIARGRLLKLADVPAPGPVAGTWLLEHADENRDGVPGWGLPVAWDAFGDGSINPTHTEYAISTGIAVQALLDWLDASQAAPRTRILELVAQVLKPYLDRAAWSPGGMLPYSLRESDRRYDTFNSAAFLAGQMQRFSKLTSDTVLAARLQAAADSTMQALLTHKQVSPDGSAWYWNYSIQERVPNDLAHAAFIVDAVTTYIASGGRLAGRFDRPKVVAYLLQFNDAKADGVRAWPRFRTDGSSPTRLVDLASALHTACSEPALSGMRSALLRQVATHLGKDGRYAKYPVASASPNVVVAEYEAYLLRALASCAANPMPGG